ncbi:hypothetical protein G6L37_00910 [Agrobacterium rubi]|nr:hypothetical protein [Agrobacterium rubi]NTF23951.1 hypothetical protein [Agrobacterium rubi]
MRETEKVIISCYLLAEGLDGNSASGFLDALEAGVAAGETDAMQMRDEFRMRPAAGLPEGSLGEIVAAMKMLDELQEREEALEGICIELGILQGIVSAELPHDLAARIAVRRIAGLSGISRGAA